MAANKFASEDLQKANLLLNIDSNLEHSKNMKKSKFACKSELPFKSGRRDLEMVVI